MARRRQTAAQRRASLRNLAKARRARRARGRGSNPPRRKRRRAAAAPARRRRKAPSARRYSYSRPRRRVVRANPDRRRRRYRRNQFGGGNIVRRGVKVATDAGWGLIGKGTVNWVTSLLPFPRDGLMGQGVKALITLIVPPMLSRFRFVGQDGAHMMMVGGMMAILEPYAKMVPILGPQLGEEPYLGEYLGAYQNNAYLGAYQESVPVDEGMGAYADAGSGGDGSAQYY